MDANVANRHIHIASATGNQRDCNEGNKAK